MEWIKYTHVEVVIYQDPNSPYEKQIFKFDEAEIVFTSNTLIVQNVDEKGNIKGRVFPLNKIKTYTLET